MRQFNYNVLGISKHIRAEWLFTFVYGFFLIWVLFVSAEKAFSKNTLIMITDKSCPYCQAWERDVGKLYSMTKIANQFPLIRVTAGETELEFLTNLEEVRGTPTFIFLTDDLEIGRIEGYSDAEMFWWLVDDIVGQVQKMEE